MCLLHWPICCSVSTVLWGALRLQHEPYKEPSTRQRTNQVQLSVFVLISQHFSCNLLYERFDIATPSALLITLKRQWRVTRQEESDATTQHELEFSVEAAQQHYMTATEPPRLPFVHTGQMTKVCYCSLAHWPYPSLAEGHFSTGETWPNSLWYQSLCVFAGNIIMKITP